MTHLYFEYQNSFAIGADLLYYQAQEKVAKNPHCNLSVRKYENHTEQSYLLKLEFLVDYTLESLPLLDNIDLILKLA